MIYGIWPPVPQYICTAVLKSNFHRLFFKVNAIKTLIHRAFKISSNYFKMNEEIDFLLRYFRNNG